MVAEREHRRLACIHVLEIGIRFFPVNDELGFRLCCLGVEPHYALDPLRVSRFHDGSVTYVCISCCASQATGYAVNSGDFLPYFPAIHRSRRPGLLLRCSPTPEISAVPSIALPVLIDDAAITKNQRAYPVHAVSLRQTCRIAMTRHGRAVARCRLTFEPSEDAWRN
jgi:hypothetical protein